MWGHDPALLDGVLPTFAQRLQEQGYQTGFVGKWHLGFGTQNPVDWSQPLRPGFEEAGFHDGYGIPSSLDIPPYLYVKNHQPVELPTATVQGSSPARNGGAGFWRRGPAAPSFDFEDCLPHLTQRAVDWLEQQKSNIPFCLYFALPAPHTPWLPTEKFRGKSKAGVYGDFVTMVDDAVGQVLDALSRNGFEENTLVLFTSDNGAHWTPNDKAMFDHRANGLRRGQKADIWEGGHRVPFLIRWPAQVEAQSTHSHPVCLTDVHRTLIELAAGDTEVSGEDSWSFMSALQGEDAATRPHLVSHSINGTFAIREHGWKMIPALGSGGFSNPKTIQPSPDDAPGQLYDLNVDPREQKNLWLQHPERVDRLHSLLSQIQTKGERK